MTIFLVIDPEAVHADHPISALRGAFFFGRPTLLLQGDGAPPRRGRGGRRSSRGDTASLSQNCDAVSPPRSRSARGVGSLPLCRNSKFPPPNLFGRCATRNAIERCAISALRAFLVPLVIEEATSAAIADFVLAAQRFRHCHQPLDPRRIGFRGGARLARLGVIARKAAAGASNRFEHAGPLRSPPSCPMARTLIWPGATCPQRSRPPGR